MSIDRNHAGSAAAESLPAPDHFIDISSKVCPMTFVHTRLALDKLGPGQVLAVRMAGEEPRRNVPRTSAQQGHAVLGTVEHEDGTVTLYLRKKRA